MTTEIQVTGTPTINNKQLKKYTNQIFKMGMNIRNNMLGIAYVLAQIDESGCFVDDGFESVHEYAQKVCGIKRAQSYAMIKAGRNYIAPVEGSKVFKVASVLTHEPTKDYSLSQLQALLPLNDVELAKSWSYDGIIDSEMTVQQIKQIVSDYRKCNISDGASGDGDGEGEEVGKTKTKATPDTTFTIKHKITIGSYHDGRLYISVDDTEVDFETLEEMPFGQIVKGLMEV
jgi:hypothetical protein